MLGLAVRIVSGVIIVLRRLLEWGWVRHVVGACWLVGEVEMRSRLVQMFLIFFNIYAFLVNVQDTKAG